MARRQETKSELRAAFANRELRKAKFNYPAGSTGIFMQVTLSILYMYMILISYTWMGISGAVLVSCTFLIVLFLPVLYRIAMDYRKKQKARNEAVPTTMKPGVEQES